MIIERKLISYSIDVAWELRKSDQAEGIHIQDIKIGGAFVGNPAKENTPCSEAPASASCSQDENLGAYAGWEPEVQALLQVGRYS